MATSFPGAVDSFPRPGEFDNTDDAGMELDVMLDHHSDAIEAMQTSMLAGGPLRVVVEDSSTTINVVAADHGKFIRLTAATAVSVILPADAPIGTQVEFQATTAAGLATFSPATNALIEDAKPSAIMDGEGSAVVALVVRLASTYSVWTLVGDLA